MQRIYLSPPHLAGEERSLLLDAFDSNWITTMGPHVEGFERDMCDAMSIRGATALSSGTAALHLALEMLGVQQGDTVVCSDLTFAASANAITYCGARPIFIDSDRMSWNMDPRLLADELQVCRKAGRMPRAAVIVDLYGQTADYEPLLAMCNEYGVALIEDAAEALGATYQGKAAGSFGEMGVYSFNGNKIITTSGGGMLVSNNTGYTTRAKHLATQARDPFPYYHHTAIGYNYRMSNLLAAIGRAQLRHLEAKVDRRRGIFQRYADALQELPGVTFMPEAPYGRANRWLTCCTVQPEVLGVTNEDIRLHLESHNIESRHVWKPMHLQPVFNGCRVVGGAVSEDLFSRGLCLPSGSAMSDADVDRVAETILAFVKERTAHVP